MFLTAKLAKNYAKNAKLYFEVKAKGSQRLLNLCEPCLISLRTLRLNFFNENDLLQSQIQHLFPKFPFRKAYS